MRAAQDERIDLRIGSQNMFQMLPHDEFDYSKNIFGATPPHKFGYYCFSDGFGVIDADGETVYDNTGETVLFQTGPQSERLEWGKAMLQTTYEDIGRR